MSTEERDRVIAMVNEFRKTQRKRFWRRLLSAFIAGGCIVLALYIFFTRM